MNSVGISAGGGNAAGEEPLRLNVLVVYEDAGTGLRARQTLEQTVRRLKADAEVQVNLWQFDLLCEPGLRQRVATQAAEADIVMVSLHGHGELPASVSSWFGEWWFGRRGSGPCALVVSLDDDAQDAPRATQMVEALGAAARLAGVALFRHPGEAQAGLEPAIAGNGGPVGTRATGLEEALLRLSSYSS